MNSILIAAALTFSQAEAPPSPELVERFIAALPQPRRPLDAIDSEELARLAQRNPGREGDIRPILEAHARCTAPVRQSSTERVFQGVAARLGTANVEALIRFYSGPDLARFGALAEKTDKSTEENAELERLLAAYPMQAMMDAMQSSGMAIFDDDAFMSAMDACDRARVAELSRANLRSED